MSSQRQRYIDQIRCLPLQIAALVRSRTPEQLATSTLPGEWTVAQNVHHLADSHVNSYVRCKLIATEDHPTLRPYDQERWAEFPDAVDGDVSASLMLLTNLHARWVRFWETLPDRAWTRSGHHPEIGAVTLSDQLAHYAGHGHAHVEQMQRTILAGTARDDSIAVRAECPADVVAIRAVNEAAFDTPEEPAIVDQVRRSPHFVPELSLVAERDGEILGHALFSEATIEGAGDPVTVLSLGPIAVVPDHQKRGIGGQLIRAGIERARALGYRAVFLIGHPTYYPHFGFISANNFGIGCASFSVSDEVFMVYLLRPDGLHGVRGDLLYPPAFH